VVGQTVLDQHFPGGIGSSVQATGTAAAMPRIATKVECLVLGDNFVVLPGQAVTDDRLSRVAQEQRT
jgi:hypothetical protein